MISIFARVDEWGIKCAFYSRVEIKSGVWSGWDKKKVAYSGVGENVGVYIGLTRDIVGIKRSMQSVWTKMRKEFGGDKKVRAR